MDLNANSKHFYRLIVGEIEKKSYLKAINWLTVIISSNADNNPNNNLNYVYYLLRAHCYQSVGSKEALDMALEDVFGAIRLADNRFQCYLQGALILLDLKRFEESLQMFEKSIRINAHLFGLLINQLNYLKFKILVKQGFDEVLSLKSAINYRYLEECIENIDSDSKINKFDILPLIVDCDNDSNVQSLANHSVSVKNCENLKAISESMSDSKVGSFPEGLSASNFGSINAINNCWKPMNAQDFAKSDQQFDDCNQCSDETQMIRFDDNLMHESVKSMATSGPIVTEVDESEERYSMNCDFNKNSIAPEDWGEEKKLNSIQTWIDETWNSDNVSKLCDFEGNDQSPPFCFQRNKKRRTVSLGNSFPADISSEASHRSSASSLAQNREMPTNLMRLRGVYIANLKNNFEHKVMKDMLKQYGTVVDFYQPSGVGYAFIHYKIHESATQLVCDWQSKSFSECKDNKTLLLRFTPTQEQMVKYNSMSYSQYKKRCNDGHECERWRSGQRCELNKECPYRHIGLNRSIDTLPDKKKASWRL